MYDTTLLLFQSRHNFEHPRHTMYTHYSQSVSLGASASSSIVVIFITDTLYQQSIFKIAQTFQYISVSC